MTVITPCSWDPGFVVFWTRRVSVLSDTAPAGKDTIASTVKKRKALPRILMKSPFLFGSKKVKPLIAVPVKQDTLFFRGLKVKKMDSGSSRTAGFR
jgi:hypothetical protein